MKRITLTVMIAIAIIAAAMTISIPQAREARAAGIKDALLQNGEPVVGVYYYPWFGGPPWRFVGWTAPYEYNNINNKKDIKELLKSITEYQINHAAFSYWDNGNSFNLFKKSIGIAEELLKEGRGLYMSPYLEPSTINKTYDTPKGQDPNIEFISKYMAEFGKSPCFPDIGGKKLTNIYVSYYTPGASDDGFREFLGAKYGSIEKLSQEWKKDYPDFSSVRISDAKPMNTSFADLQEFRADGFIKGWQRTIKEVEGRTGFKTVYTGDNSNSTLGLTAYMKGHTGLTWYTFGWEMNGPFRRPKICSEVAKFTDTLFLYTISPGYVDRQQRWTGGRIERDPFLYEYSWVQAMSTLPEGIMILTHTEWFEGSVIDETKEYGRKYLELTEMFGSIFKETFESGFAEKRRKKDIAVVYNEYLPFRLNASGEGGKDKDVLGMVKLLETLSQSFDVIPEPYLTAEELKGRKVVIVPACGFNLGKNGKGEFADSVIFDWVKATPGTAVFVTLSKKWADMLGLKYSEAAESGGEYEFGGVKFSDGSAKLKITGMPAGSEVLSYFTDKNPKIIKCGFKNGGSVIFINGEFGSDFLDAFYAPLGEGKYDDSRPRMFESALRTVYPAYSKTVDSYEIKAAPVLKAGGTMVVLAASAVPWGQIVEWRDVGWGIGVGHSNEFTKPWARKNVTFALDIPQGTAVTEVTAVSSDSGNFQAVDFSMKDGKLVFSYPIGFYAVFAVQLCPVRIECPVMEISPGKKISVPVLVSNPGKAKAEGSVRLKGSPGISSKEISFAVEAGGSQKIELPVEAADYATGTRTVALEVMSGRQRYVFWKGMKCLANAQPVLLTTRIIGKAGSVREVDLRFLNSGGSAVKDMKIQLGGVKGSVSVIEPGKEAPSVKMKITMPVPAAPEEISAEGSCDVSYAENGKEVSMQLPFKFIAIPLKPAVPEHVVQGRTDIYLISQFDGFKRKDWEPASVSLADLPKGLSASSTALFSDEGVSVPFEIKDNRMVFMVNLRGADFVKYYLYSGLKKAGVPGTDLKARSYLENKPGFISVGNGSIQWVFDERFSGNPVSISAAGYKDIAHYMGGSFAVRYNSNVRPVEEINSDADWDLETIDRIPSTLRVISSGPVEYCFENRVENETFSVRDVWTFWSLAKYCVLSREITFKKDARFFDFVPVSARLDASQFTQGWPNGVGFMPEKTKDKKGWLETWAVSDGYLMYAGEPKNTPRACGMIILDKDPVKRVRYGFFDSDYDVRLRSKKEFRQGEKLALRIAIAVGKRIYPADITPLREKILNPPLVWVANEK